MLNNVHDVICTLLLIPAATHPHDYSCYLCKIQWDGFVYSCSLCNFELTLDDFLKPKEITVSIHGHPGILVLKQISFICDFCGITGDHSPYLCTTFNLVKMISLKIGCARFVTRTSIQGMAVTVVLIPVAIILLMYIVLPIKRFGMEKLSCEHMVAVEIKHAYHDHNLRLIFSGEVKDNSQCDGCMRLISTLFYSCEQSRGVTIQYAMLAGLLTMDLATNATTKIADSSFDATFDDGKILEDIDERFKEALHESLNLIIEVVKQTSIGEQTVTTEIKHEYHDHNLRLTFSGEIEDDSQCNGCRRPISAHFYSCDQCKFFLHKACSELSKEKGHPFHKHVLTLTNTSLNPVDNYSICYGCSRPFHGFSYRCYNEDFKSYFIWDIRCISLSDTLEHPSHEHSLCLVHNFRMKYCSGGLGVIWKDKVAYRCMKHYDFVLDMECVTLPLTASYKNDRHPLTYSDDSSSSHSQCY
ncbi:hypothetical protein F3Y22_tig00117048pilonHSYRG00187 [Hibiscus syriacus]|uniref:Phorbol-ester/DAG-type domain-containing protein n=1 Tax=Hibiscus syriacus TaxID=106335 RepID=A0A6A2WLT7_HIBSY|nr:hypothetical protein F3Y22_tig00117048pilonHSYRG00187 [Hibiscus syriacus]